VGEKPSKRLKIPFQDLPKGRFLCLKPNFHPFADSPKKKKNSEFQGIRLIVFDPVNASQG
jgi:hypothetical protein